MSSRYLALVLTIVLTGSVVHAEDDEPKLEPGGKVVITVAMESGEKKEIVALTPKRQREIIAKLSPSLVRVEYTLKFDKGEPPGGSYSPYGDDGEYMGDGDEHIREERPMEIPGFLIGERHVVTNDIGIHPRFIRSIQVRHGDTLVGASVESYAIRQSARILTLERPLPGTKALSFVAKKKGPYLMVSHGRENGTWTVNLAPFGLSTAITDDGYKFAKAPNDVLVIDAKGTPVGVSMATEQPLDGSWKGSPLDWKALSATDRSAWVGRARANSDAALLRVKLSFRSPKSTGGRAYYSRYSSSSGDSGKTERNVTGVLVGPKTVLVLANLKPSVTARLKRIQVFVSEDKPAVGTFKATLADYGAFVITVDEELPGPMTLSTQPVFSMRNILLSTAEIRLQGEKRVSYFNHSRNSGFSIGWQRQVYPEMSGDANTPFVSDASGTLVALPIARRQKVAVKSNWGGDEVELTHASYLASVLADLENNIDKNNVPLVEADENRIAWVGVNLQKLNRELARATKVSELTNDGHIGALVSYVHPESPEGKAGIRQGAILLRLHVEGQPKPLEITRDGGAGWGILWNRLSEYRDQDLERRPPWPSARSPLAGSLTEIGFGKGYTVEFFQDGRVQRKDFSVIEGPPHYDSAGRFKSKLLGMTVRDLTYEVRRYFQMTADKPGVIVSKVKSGERGSVAGLKTYEIITHVNGRPAVNVETFKKQVAGQKELRLTVKRFIHTRTVKIRMDR